MARQTAGLLTAIAAVVGALGGAKPALADPQALSPNVPVEVEDALVVPKGVFQLQLDQRFTHDPTATSSGTLSMFEPVFKLGAVKGLQLDFSPSYNLGSASSVNNGLVTIDTLYNFNHDSKWIPAFAVHGYVQKGFGHGNTETQYTLRTIAT